MSASFAERCRPDRFDVVVGQGAAVSYLAESAGFEHPPSVFLFGPSGCGKTSLAEIYARTLLCTGGEDPPCHAQALCINCRAFLQRTHPSCHVLGMGECFEEAAFLQHVAHGFRVESFGNNRLVVMVPVATALSQTGFETIRRHLKRPPPRSVFIICANTRDEVGREIDDLLQPVPVLPPTVPDRLVFARRVCLAANTQADEDALTTLALQAGPSFLRVARDIETCSRNGPLTSTSIRAALYLDEAAPALRYLSCVAEGRSLSEQIGILDGWDAASTLKAQRVEAALGALLRRHLLQQADAAGELDDIGDEKAVALMDGLLRNADRMQLSLRQLWKSMLGVWRDLAQITPAKLVATVWEFDELINGGAQTSGERTKRKRLLKTHLRKRHALEQPVPVTASPVVRRSVEADHPPDHYLSRKQAEMLWNAASFLHQRFGLLLNTRITLRYPQLGITDPSRIGPFLSDLTRQLGALIDRSVGLGQFHWLYVHESKSSLGPMTQLVCHIPPSAGAVEKWARASFLEHHCGDSWSEAGFAMRRHRLAGAEKEPGQAWKRHFFLARLMCRGLHPEASVGSYQAANALKLVECLRIPRRLQGPIGPRFGAQRYGVSEGIAVGARRAASMMLPERSAFSEGRWNQLTSMWEAAEFSYRRDVEETYLRLRSQVVADWGEVSDEVEEFQRNWSKGSERRAKSRTKW